MSAAICDLRGFHTWMAIHSDERELEHKLEGACCVCLPEIRCSACNGLFLDLGIDVPGRDQTPISAHVYPGWLAAPDPSNSKPPETEGAWARFLGGQGAPPKGETEG